MKITYTTKELLLNLLGVLVVLFSMWVYVKFPFYNYINHYLAFWIWLVGLLLLIELLRRFAFEVRNYIQGLEGELYVNNNLNNLPKDFVVLNNLIIVKNKGNVDQVVVGPTGVWTIETKSHEGRISFNGEEILRDGRLLERNFLNQAWAEACSVRDLIKEKLNIIVSVQPIVVFSNRVRLNFGTRKQKGVYVIGVSWLNKLIRDNTVQNLTVSNVKVVSDLLRTYKE